MTCKFIPVSEAVKRWREDPEYVAAYDALEEEFALAAALIGARSHADMTQAQVAAAMGTTQAAVARLESGRAMPSTRSLKRFADATGMKLRISFVPDPEAGSQAESAARAYRPASVRKCSTSPGGSLTVKS